MITIKFQGHPKARAIILDHPVHLALTGNGVSGMIECTICEAQSGLFHEGEGQLADEIEGFIKNHECLALARESEVVAFAGRLREKLPKASIVVKKGAKIINGR